MKYFNNNILFFLVIIVFTLSSCNNEDINKINVIDISTTTSELPVGNSFVFKVLTDTNEDVTSITEITVNNNLINTNEFSALTAGEYTVKAVYNEVESEPLIVRAVNPTDYSQKVLVEDFTGVWCGNCPRVSYAIEQLKLQSDKIVSVAVHLYNANDPYSFDGSILLNDDLNIGGLPEGRLNRTNFWQSHQQDHLDQAFDLTGFAAPLGLAINSEISSSTINATIRVGFGETYSANLGVVVYLVENGLIHDQVNYTENLFGSGNVDPLLNFEHNDVLRAIFTNHFGDVIPSAEAQEGVTYILNLEKTIPSSVEDNDNLHLVAFVINKDTGEVINAQEAAVGEDKDFD